MVGNSNIQIDITIHRYAYATLRYPPWFSLEYAYFNRIILYVYLA